RSLSKICINSNFGGSQIPRHLKDCGSKTSAHSRFAAKENTRRPSCFEANLPKGRSYEPSPLVRDHAPSIDLGRKSGQPQRHRDHRESLCLSGEFPFNRTPYCTFAFARMKSSTSFFNRACALRSM